MTLLDKQLRGRAGAGGQPGKDQLIALSCFGRIHQFAGNLFRQQRGKKLVQCMSSRRAGMRVDYDGNLWSVRLRGKASFLKNQQSWKE